jgi:hypothetical protein
MQMNVEHRLRLISTGHTLVRHAAVAISPGANMKAYEMGRLQGFSGNVSNAIANLYKFCQLRPYEMRSWNERIARPPER